MNSIRKNFFYNASYRVFLILIPLIITPYLSRILGAEGVGFFSYTNAVVGYFVLFGMLGVSTNGMRAVAARSSQGKEAVSSAFWGIYIGQIITCFVACLAYIVYCLFFSGEYLIASLLWLPYMLSATVDISWFLFGLSEFRIPTIRNFILQTLSTVCVFLFVKGTDDVFLYIAITSGVGLVSQLCLWPYAVKHLSINKPSAKKIFFELKNNLILFIPVVAISFYTSIDKVMLGVISGMEENGYYTYAEKISSVLMAVITALGTVMLPKMTSLFTEKKRQEGIEMLNLSMWGMLMCSLFVMFGIWSVAAELVPIFLGSSFMPCIVPLCILAIRTPVVAMSNVVGNQYLLPLKRDKLYTFSVCLGAILNMLLNLILIPFWGAVGAALSTVAAELVVLFVQMINTKKELQFFTYIKNAMPCFLIGLIAMFLTRITVDVLMKLLGRGVTLLVVEITVFLIFLIAATFFIFKITRNREFCKFVEVIFPAAIAKKLIAFVLGSH